MQDTGRGQERVEAEPDALVGWFSSLESLYWVRRLIKLFLNKHSFLPACLF